MDMNKNQRKQLEDLMCKITEIEESVEFIRDEEQEKIDNMPENLQGGERYSQMENAISCLDDALQNLQDAYENIQSSTEQ